MVSFRPARAEPAAFYARAHDANECVSLSEGFESFLGEYGGKHTVVESETERSEE